MIGVIQRLLQLLVIAVVVFAVWKPSALPQQIQPLAYSLQHLIVGNQASWESFSGVWRERWQIAGQYIPALRGWAQAIPSTPPTITTQSVVNFTIQTLFIEPAKKWGSIKSNLVSSQSASVSGESIQ